MAVNLPPSLLHSQSFFASIDIGTNSFKLLIFRAYPNGRFFTVDRLKESVVLGRDFSSNSGISAQSQSRSVQALLLFKSVIDSHDIDRNHTRVVATSAVREARNKEEFVKYVKEKTGLYVDVLSGEEEAKFSYLGALQFLPVYDKLVLNVDIGGGSTEFVVGKQGKTVFCDSLKLGHVTLSENFVNHGFEVSKMREYIKSVIRESGLVEKVKECGFEIAIGSSGTIRSIEKAVGDGYYQNSASSSKILENLMKKGWRLRRTELKNVTERLCAGGKEEKVRRRRFFKGRSERIVAGAILLEEIFDLLGIEEMEVSAYGLGEGVITESLARVYNGYDFDANVGWRSVVQLAMRFNGKKRIKSRSQCASIATVILEGLRKSDKLDGNQINLIATLDEMDIEYLEAACLLHNIGLVAGKKGYHKHSYHIITNGNHLCGYNTQEIKLIASLTRHHRKKFPKSDHASITDLPKELKQKFGILCAILRFTVRLQQCEELSLQEVKLLLSDKGSKLVINEPRDQPVLSGNRQCTKEDFEAELRQELEYFKVFWQEIIGCNSSK